MKKFHIQQIDLWKWFPPNDPVSNAIARLCILKEDLSLEFNGMQPEPIIHFDKNSSVWRRLYFLRNFVRSLYEFRDAIKKLGNNKTFMNALLKEPQLIQDMFFELSKELDSNKSLITELRHNIFGGHVGEAAIKHALEKLDIDRKGLLEVELVFAEHKRVNLHYKFASELIMAYLLAGISHGDQSQELERVLEGTVSFGKYI